MSNGQNPYPGYGQQPPQGFGGYPQAPGQPPYPGGAVQTGQAAPLPPPGRESGGRRGTSRVLPIMVAAGLAVGVCGGLVVVLGTGESDAATNEPEVTGSKTGGTPDAGVEVAATTPDAAPEPPPPDAAPEPPPIKKITVKFDVEPSNATVTVDGEEIEDNAYTVELEPDKSKTVKIVAKASGYKTFKDERTIDGDDTVEIKLDKRSSGRRNTGRRTGGGRRTGSGGGRIDF